LQGKPSATAQPPAPPAQQQAAYAAPVTAQTTPPGATTTAPAAPSQPPTQTPNNGGWQAVQPAMSGAPAGTQTAQPSAQNTVQPAMPSQNSLMVQIAAVSDPEDASVLVGALRRRGYSVSANRNPADNLIHVCIGPFSNRNDANAMRQKLLNDGYNAIVLP